MKWLFFKLIKPVSLLFYDKSFLKGKYFNANGDGWFWVFNGIWFQKILGFNRSIPFPINPTIRISSVKNLILGENNLNNFQSPGVYFQNFNGRIILGNNIYIAPNVGLITANHDYKNLDNHLEGKDIIIGDNSWIGMNSIVLPGVILGPKTVVGAGSVVTKSFEMGNVIIAGNPAKIIKEL